MILFNKRTIWGNLHCQDKLIEFRNSIVDYFNNCSFDEWSRHFSENENARSIRSNLNQNLPYIEDIVNGADVTTYITYTPPPIVGGYRQNINLVANIFHLHQFEIEPTYLLDVVDRAIGVYKSDQKKSLVRTFNPFFWVGILLDLVVSIPFTLLGKAGLNTKAIEESILGKISKFILYIVSLIAGIITIAQPLGWLDRLKNFITL